MAQDMCPPNSKAVVSVADEAVDQYTAAGFTPVKSAEPKQAPRKSADKK